MQYAINSFLFFNQYWKQAVVLRKNPYFCHKEIIDIRTQKRYWNEPIVIIGIKCHMIFFAVIPYFLGHIVWYVSKSIVGSLYLAKKSILEALSFQKKPQIFSSLIFKNILYCIQQIARAVFYTLSIQMSVVFLGVVSPLEARKTIAELEQSWHEGNYYEQDVRRDLPKDMNLLAFLFLRMIDCKSHYLHLTDQATNQVFYLAPCFRCLGNTQDKNIIQIRD